MCDEYKFRKLTVEALEFFQKHPNATDQYAVQDMIAELLWLRTAPKKTTPPEARSPEMPNTSQEVHDTLIDAERYRWLRSNGATGAIYAPNARLEMAQGKMLDDACDAGRLLPQHSQEAPHK